MFATTTDNATERVYFFAFSINLVGETTKKKLEHLLNLLIVVNSLLNVNRQTINNVLLINAEQHNSMKILISIFAIMISFVEKYKFAIIGTILIHLMAFEVMVLTNLKVEVPLINRAAYVELEMDDIEIAEIPSIPNQNIPDGELMSNEASNRDPNLTDASEEFNSETYSKTSVEKEVWNEAKALEAATKTTNWNKRETITNTITNNNNPISNNRQNTASNTPNTETKAYKGSSTINFLVKWRKKIYIPNTIYTCKNGGLVRVNIWVNQAGKVVNAEVDETISVNDECLWREALKSAKKAKFTRYTGIAGKQEGYIEYTFQKQ